MRRQLIPILFGGRSGGISNLAGTVFLDWIIAGQFEFFLSGQTAVATDILEIRYTTLADTGFASSLGTWSDTLNLGEIDDGAVEIFEDLPASGEYLAQGRLVRGLQATAWSASVNFIIGPISFTSANFTFEENQTNIGTVTTDYPATFEITGGADEAKVSINSTSGLVSVVDLGDANFESPGDTDTDGVFEFEVTATRTADGVQVVDDFTGTVSNIVTEAAYAYRGFHFTTSGTIHTFSMDIGTASADRLVILGIARQASATAAPSSVTVNGHALTQAAGFGYVPGSGSEGGYYYGLVPTGDGSQTVTINYTAGAGTERFCWVWTATALQSNTPKDTAVNAAFGGGASMTMSVDGGDFMFAHYRATTNTSPAFSGSTEAPDNSRDATGVEVRGIGGDWLVNNTNAAFTIEFSGDATGIAAAISFK